MRTIQDSRTSQDVARIVPAQKQYRVVPGRLISIVVTLAVCGCALPKRVALNELDTPDTSPNEAMSVSETEPEIENDFVTLLPSEPAVLTVGYQSQSDSGEPINEQGPMKSGALTLQTVLASVQESYPLLRAAYFSRNIAFGNHLAAHGAFDTKLKGASENGAVGQYQTYRQNIGFEQPTMSGSNFFGGYRIGRGDFQPWYQERLTDDSGEFRAGVQVPLMRDVNIDQRRADLWKTSVGQQLAEPEIRLQQIDFVRAASYAYWDWVAAGRRIEIAEELLLLAENRHDGIRLKVEVGASGPPVLQDNKRLIVSREAKLIDEQRKLRQTAVKLSLFLRDADGTPVVPNSAQLPAFPQHFEMDQDGEIEDIQLALMQRPEFASLDFQRRQLSIDRQQAGNEALPDLRASMLAAQDVGEHATQKRDKRAFEMEASLFLEVPLQRRKARGKIIATEGKLSQLSAKRRMMADKVTSEVQMAVAGLQAAAQKIERAREAVQLAVQMADIERRTFELGGKSDLFAVNLREQQTAEARNLEVDAMLEYYLSLADRDAAVGIGLESEPNRSAAQ